MTHHELARQIQNLHDLGYPALAGMAAEDFDALLLPLRDRTRSDDRPEVDGRIPFVLVVRGSLVPTVEAVVRWSVRGKAGWTDMEAELPGFTPTEDVEVPAEPVYLLLDVDTGRDTLGVCPDDALPKIRAAGRTPLTIDEGVALVTHFPEIFTTHNAFQALGSRAQNKRVPSPGPGTRCAS